MVPVWGWAGFPSKPFLGSSSTLPILWLEISCFQPVFIHCPFLYPAVVPILPTSLALTPGYAQIALYFFLLLHQIRPRCCFLVLSLHSPLIIPVFNIYLLQPAFLPQCADTVAASSPNKLLVEPWAANIF